jgi:DNA gyrase/topoisomerase IV subunit B
MADTLRIASWNVNSIRLRLEGAFETESISTTLMGENVKARRKFIEKNALDVKNLDI